MAGTVTAPRVISSSIIGLDWQVTEGEAVGSPPFTPKQFLVAQILNRNPDPSYIHPQGTHGSFFKRKDGERIVSQAFKAELKFWGGRFQIVPFLDSVMNGGAGISPVYSEFTITGGSTITNLFTSGMKPGHNTSPYTSAGAVPSFYLTLTPASGPAFPVAVSVYRDAARTQLVASGSVTAAATPTALTPAGSSGLSMTITLASPLAQTPVAALNNLTFSWSSTHQKYFKLYYTDGANTYVLSDCVVEQLKLESQENGALEVTAMIMAKRHTVFASSVFAIDQSILDMVPYSHSELTINNDLLGTPYSPVVDSFELTIKNNVLQYIGNAPTPQKLIKRGWTEITGNLKGEWSNELDQIVEQARSNTAVGTGFKRMSAAFTLNSKAMTFTLYNAKPVLKDAGIANELVEKVDIDWEHFLDPADTNAGVPQVTIQV